MKVKSFATDFLFGNSSVTAALKANKRSLIKLLTNNSSTTQAAIRLAQKLEIPIIETDTKRLDRLSENRPHNGLVLESRPFEFDFCDQLLEYNIESDEYSLKTAKKPLSYKYSGTKFPLWIALDQIIDPQNFGAIIRTSYFLGVDGIVTSSKKSAPASPFASKASAGAMELANIYQTDLSKFINLSSRNGWQIIGTNLNSKNSRFIAKNEDLLNVPTILVIGNEHSGLRKGLSDLCDFHLVIPGGNQDSSVDSLNVSVATGILINHLL